MGHKEVKLELKRLESDLENEESDLRRKGWQYDRYFRAGLYVVETAITTQTDGTQYATADIMKIGCSGGVLGRLHSYKEMNNKLLKALVDEPVDSYSKWEAVTRDANMFRRELLDELAGSGKITLEDVAAAMIAVHRRYDEETAPQGL